MLRILMISVLVLFILLVFLFIPLDVSLNVSLLRLSNISNPSSFYFSHYQNHNE